MLKHICITAFIVFFVTISSAYAQKNNQVSPSDAKTEVKFLDDISTEVEPVPVTTTDPKSVFRDVKFSSKKVTASTNSTAAIEKASGLQFKYALLMDTEVEQISNLSLFNTIDDWYGTRYRLGGTTKSGIDCSALMQTMYSTVFELSIPRTAREQYKFTDRISRAELKEGDLVFFNTTGGVSHVGMYLQNNKFIHASTSGVMISDLYDEYWVKRFIGAGRVEAPAEEATATASNL